MKANGVIVVIAGILLAAAAGAVSVPPPQAPKPAEDVVTVEGIRLRDIIGAEALPSIPRTWKLISVSPGEMSNSSNLWFQDADGAIYMLQGFTSQNKFVIHERIYKIPAK